MHDIAKHEEALEMFCNKHGLNATALYDEVKAIRKERADRAAERANDPKVAEAKAKKAEAKAKKALEETKERINKWLEGGSFNLYSCLVGEIHPGCTALVRVGKDVIQTSLGVSIPMDEAQAAWWRIVSGDKTVEGLRTSSGQYTLKANGTFRAGCHVIPRENVEAVARQLGWI